MIGGFFLYCDIIRDLRSLEIQFEFESDGPIRKFGHACPLLVVVKRLKPLTALSGTVYRLASSMSDHTPVLFNVFEEWNEESVVPRISFVPLVILADFHRSTKLQTQHPTLVT